jgi:hypothetical protein
MAGGTDRVTRGVRLDILATRMQRARVDPTKGEADAHRVVVQLVFQARTDVQHASCWRLFFTSFRLQPFAHRSQCRLTGFVVCLARFPKRHVLLALRSVKSGSLCDEPGAILHERDPSLPLGAAETLRLERRHPDCDQRRR